MKDPITIDRSDRVTRLTIDRPPLNILDLATIAALDQTVSALAEDADLQVLVIRGGGEKAFSAGVAVEDHTPDRVESMLGSFHALLVGLMELPAVVIGAVRGHCLGGGMELAAACDLILATEDSRFGQPEIKLGCFPPMAAAFYPQLIGTRQTRDLLLTGRLIDADEAHGLGFVNRICSRRDFEAAVDSLVGEVAAHSLAVTRLTKRAIWSSRHGAFTAALATCERLYNHELVSTQDMQEGLQAFLEKREPRWKHK